MLFQELQIPQMFNWPNTSLNPYTYIINDVPRAAHRRKVPWATYNLKCMHTYGLIPLTISKPRSKITNLNVTTHMVLIPLIMSRPRFKTIDTIATTHKVLIIPLIMSRLRSKTIDPNATTHKVLMPLIMSRLRSKIIDPNATTHRVLNGTYEYIATWTNKHYVQQWMSCNIVLMKTNGCSIFVNQISFPFGYLFGHIHLGLL
jgi:hypothetical protein